MFPKAQGDPKATTALGSDQRFDLILRAWEAINAERDLRSVLAAVADVLVPIVPFDGVAVIAHELNLPLPYALHLVGIPSLDGETVADFIARLKPRMAVSAPPIARRRIPYHGSEVERLVSKGLPHTCDDLLKQDAWYDWEFKQAAAGLRSYASIPLYVRGKLIGSAVFTRRAPIPFTPEQAAVLSEVSRAIAVAVANALAYEEISRLRDRLEAENIELRAQLDHEPWRSEIVGDSPALRKVIEAIDQVAATDSTVLITGQTGTGKELVARAIHRRSERARKPLVMVNCAAIPETLLASELFGHERGAFTGAIERRKGRFEQANGGTLFLDEIAELSPDVQVTLLRVLQERKFERLGGTETLQADVRIVAATNRALAEAVRAGDFREDLYYRLNVFPIALPPLRERPEDISSLASHFATKHSERMGKKISRIERRSMKMLESYDWPGNVRELENIIERAVILSRNGTLRVAPESLSGAARTEDLGVHLKTQEREIIEAALRASRGRVSGSKGAAKRLGLAPSTLEFRIKRLGIDKFQYWNRG